MADTSFDRKETSRYFNDTMNDKLNFHNSNLFVVLYFGLILNKLIKDNDHILSIVFFILIGLYIIYQVIMKQYTVNNAHKIDNIANNDELNKDISNNKIFIEKFKNVLKIIDKINFHFFIILIIYGTICLIN